MRKILASATLGVLLIGGGTAFAAPAQIPTGDFVKVAEAKVSLVTPNGTVSYTEGAPFNIQDYLEGHNVSGKYSYGDGTPLDEDDVSSLSEEITLYSSAFKGENKVIELNLPVKTIENSDLLVGEERVIEEGVVGQAIETIITTERPGESGTTTLKESSLTILKAPVAKVVEKGTKEPAPEPVSVNSNSNSYSSYDSSSSYAGGSYDNTPVPAPSAPSGSILETAYKYLGVPYVYGGSTPAGFDCSGFTSYVFAQHGISLPRVSYQQANVGRAVSLSEALPGDLLILNGAGHVGIYVGDGKLIHAPRPGKSVEITQLSYFSVDSIRRI